MRNRKTTFAMTAIIAMAGTIFMTGCGASKSKSDLDRYAEALETLSSEMEIFNSEMEEAAAEQAAEQASEWAEYESEQAAILAEYESEQEELKKYATYQDSIYYGDIPDETEIADIQREYSVGEVLEDRFRDIYFISSYEYQEENEYLAPAEGNKYVAFEISVENVSEDIFIDSSLDMFDCYADGYECELLGNNNQPEGILSPGRYTRGILVYEVPEDAQKIELLYYPEYLPVEYISFIYSENASCEYTPSDHIRIETENGNEPVIKHPTKVDVQSGPEIFEVTLNGIDQNISSEYREDFVPDGFHIVTFDIDIANVSNETKSYSSEDVYMYADGRCCTNIYIDDDFIYTEIAPGKKINGTISYVVPDGSEYLELEYLADEEETLLRVVK